MSPYNGSESINATGVVVNDYFYCRQSHNSKEYYHHRPDKDQEEASNRNLGRHCRHHKRRMMIGMSLSSSFLLSLLFCTLILLTAAASAASPAAAFSPIGTATRTTTTTTTKMITTRSSSSLSAAGTFHSSPFLLSCRFQDAPIFNMPTSQLQLHQITPTNHRRQSMASRSSRLIVRYMSSVGDGPGQGKGRGGGGGGKAAGGGGLGDFLDPMRGDDSENLQRARARMSEDRLPISFGIVQPDDVDADNEEDEDDDDDDDEEGMSSGGNVTAQDNIGGAITTRATAAATNPFKQAQGQSSDLVKHNPYIDVVSRLSPSELISKFTQTAHPRVQDAVRATILGLIGTLPKMAFDTTTVTTGARLASLMFQLQMTGYMFKNAEYRLSLSRSLGLGNASSSASSSNLLLSGSSADDDDDDDDEMMEKTKSDPLTGKVRGKIRIHYGGPSEKNNNDTSATQSNNVFPEQNLSYSSFSSSTGSEVLDDNTKDNTTTTTTAKGENKDDEEDDDDDDGDMDLTTPTEIEVDAAAYMSELRSEVQKLREELTQTRRANEEAIRKDLLLYIRTLPERQMRELTNTISQDVLVAMKALVNVVLGGIGEGKINPDTVTEQSGEAMAQLCMWQLVVGYNLRELEVREEIKNALMRNGVKTKKEQSSGRDDGTDGDEEEGGIFDFGPGALE